MFWVLLLAFSICSIDLARRAPISAWHVIRLDAREAKRRVMLKASFTDLGWNETWLVVTGRHPVGRRPRVRHPICRAFLSSPLFYISGGLILRGVAFEFRDKTHEAVGI